MAIPNSDEMRDPFPGIRWGGPSAPGSAGASGGAADSEPAGAVTPPWGPSQPAARYPASTGGTVEPGQADASRISPGPQADYSDTGAGAGHAGHYPRRDWQAPDGRQ
jgi:hypothetical protein